MSGANHVAGGLILTGIYLSMWDVNIYSKPQYLGFAILFALLPDIDHTKSVVGKLFYPVAKYLDRKFGHRTITHSLLCYFMLALIVGIIERTWFDSTIISSIFLWAYGSHLILDMLTIQGVPLLYPFKKNPCVIPGNPKYRFKSSNFRTESIAFCLFVMIGFSCKDLFANGFWNTYDKAFATLKSVHNDATLSSNVLLVRYDIQANGKALFGGGYLVESNPERLTLFNQETGFLTITKADHVKRLVPIRTNKMKEVKEVAFSGISFDSLQRLVKNKAIAQIKLQAELPINYTKDNAPQSGTAISLDNVFNPVFRSTDIDSIDQNTGKEISLIKLQIAEERQKQHVYLMQKEQAQKQYQERYNQWQQQLNSSDLLEREKAIKAQGEIKPETGTSVAPVNNIPALQIRLNYLLQNLHVRKKQSVNGYLSYIEIR